MKIKVLFFVGIMALAGFAMKPSGASANPALIEHGGTIYKVENSHLRPFTTPASYFSYKHSFSEATKVASLDENLVIGEPMPPKEGALVQDGQTVYVIEHGKKRGFVTWEIFTSLGYSPANIIKADTSAILAGDAVITSDQRHPRGALVEHAGTVYFMGSDLRYPIPSMEVFYSWENLLEDVVPANMHDLATLTGPPVQFKGNAGYATACEQEKMAEMDKYTAEGLDVVAVEGMVVLPDSIDPASLKVSQDFLGESFVRPDGSFCLVIEDSYSSLIYAGSHDDQKIYLIADPRLAIADDYLLIDVDSTMDAVFRESDGIPEIYQLVEYSEFKEMVRHELQFLSTENDLQAISETAQFIEALERLIEAMLSSEGELELQLDSDPDYLF